MRANRTTSTELRLARHLRPGRPKLGCELLARAVYYARRHGIAGACSRALLSFRRLYGGNRMVLFFCELERGDLQEPALPPRASIVCKQQRCDVTDEDAAQIIDSCNPSLAGCRFVERFDKGAWLWLFKFEARLAAFGWTLVGGTIEPHYFPLGKNDVHLFDFFVFPQYRGRRINPALVNFILSQLSRRSSRAFIEAAEWNAPQLSSLSRTPFVRLGMARKYCFLRRTVVFWRQPRLSAASK